MVASVYHRFKVERLFHRMKRPTLADSDSTRYSVRVVSRTFDILELLRDTDRPLSLGDISRRLGMVKSSGFRLLRTLEHRGYVERIGDDGRYHLGPELMTLMRGPAGHRHGAFVFTGHRQDAGDGRDPRRPAGGHHPLNNVRDVIGGLHREASLSRRFCGR